MNTNDIYYTKYLKYKNKYLNAKEKIGGGETPCPKIVTAVTQSYSVLQFLVYYDCNYSQIMSHIPERLKAFTYKEFQDYNSKNKKPITIDYLKKKGFTPEILKTIGFPQSEMLKKVSPYKLFNKGISFSKMRSEYPTLTMTDIKSAGFGVRPELSTPEIMKNIRDACYTLREFSEMYDLKIIIDTGFTFEEICDSGLYSLETLSIYFSPEQVATVSDKEYTKEEILAAIKDKSDNLDYTKLRAINNIRKDKIDIKLIKDFPLDILYFGGYSIKELLKIEIKPKEFISFFKDKNRLNSLKDDISLDDLLKDEISIKDILEVGYKPCELKEKGIPASFFMDIVEENPLLFKKLSCYKLKELKDAGYDEKQILQFKYTLEELKSNGYTLEHLLQIFGKEDDINEMLKLFSLDEILNYFSIEELSSKWVKSIIIHDKIFIEELSSPELKKRGFTVKKLFNLRFTIEELLNLGFDIDELKDFSNIVIILKRRGFNLDNFKNHNFSVKKLKESGYTARELKEGGYSARELKEGDYKPLEIKEAGYNIREFREADFSPIDLFQIGFDIREILENFNDSDLDRYLILLRTAAEKNKEENKEKNKEKVESIKQIFLIKDDLMTLYCLRNHKISLNLIIDAMINGRELSVAEMDEIIDKLKFVFIVEDFFYQRVPLEYYAKKFPYRDLINLGISIGPLVKIVKSPDYGQEDDDWRSMSSSSSNDPKLSVKEAILSGKELKELEREFSIDLIKLTLRYYFNVPYMTLLHPYYKRFNKIADEIFKRENGL